MTGIVALRPGRRFPGLPACADQSTKSFAPVPSRTLIRTGAGHDVVQDPIEAPRLALIAEIAATNRATPASSTPPDGTGVGMQLSG